MIRIVGFVKKGELIVQQYPDKPPLEEKGKDCYKYSVVEHVARSEKLVSLSFCVASACQIWLEEIFDLGEIEKPSGPIGFSTIPRMVSSFKLMSAKEGPTYFRLIIF